MIKAPDQSERDRAIAARDQTLLIDAGAGAGKTTLLVDRLLELLAPQKDDARALPLHRMAAVTFTRRAAGELRLRVRERLLRELTEAGLSDTRKRRLLDGLSSVDVAFLGTIHGFADRLLRLQPMKAQLSPSYQIMEDIESLVEETFGLLLHAVQNGTLAAELEGEEPAYVTEVERTFQEALRAGVLVRSFERDPLPPKVGLDALVYGFIVQRDRELSWEGTGAFDLKAFDATVKAFLKLANEVDGDARGTRWLMRLRTRLTELRGESDPVVLYELVGRIKGAKFRKTKDFEKGPARDLWETFSSEGGLAEQLVDPLSAAMARRLARTRPAVVRIYEQVKARHEALDSIDLLLTLRNLLRDDFEVRAFYQGLFDHLLVDELQDTDPLQAEILLYLAEGKPAAKRWKDVRVGKGRLTLVGDPKQSIYRFRRADVGMYEQIRQQIGRGDHVSVTLTANFRSTRALIAWANHRFADILGTSKEQAFDPATGQVFHQKQVAVSSTDGAGVHAVTYAFADGEKATAPRARALEGETLAAYLRWLIGKSGVQVRDADSGELRPVRWNDVAVLALVTTNLRCLFVTLDSAAVPYAMAGGVLFTTDPLHQQFLLGLRAIADRNDGVAEAALLRPPFFAVDLLDLVREKAGVNDAEAARGKAAREWVRETRKQRFARSPGQTARALLEETGLGRAIALGPNGEQRLRHLRELCLQLELRAASEGLDYDAVTARLRDWIDDPPQLDPPRPVSAEAIQVLTVHQAKGLEFPVVVLWDGMGQWNAHESTSPWRVDRDGAGWAMNTNDVRWEEPVGAGMLDKEKTFANAEKQRLVYVAATRARDLLVVPRPAWDQASDKYINARLLADVKEEWVRELDTYVEGKGARWSKNLAAQPTEVRVVSDADVMAKWTTALAGARKPRHVPRAVTALAKTEAAVALRIGEAEMETPPPRPRRIGRYGPIFGETVHRAIGLTLTRGLEPTQAVEQAARAVGLSEHLMEAAADVARALDALRAEGLVGPDRTVRLEYPVAREHGGHIVTGYVDLLSAHGADVVVIDFKTDAWDAGTKHPEYTAQVQAYVQIVGASRGGLLFSAIGRVIWSTPSS